jgi:hypothetical protein
MDLGIGFDAQAIFGAGQHETLRWLSDHGYADEHVHLSEWLVHAEDRRSKTGLGRYATTSTHRMVFCFSKSSDFGIAWAWTRPVPTARSTTCGFG